MSELELYHNIAWAAATRGDCRRTQVGAAIIHRGIVRAIGWNAAPEQSGLSCLLGDCPRGRLTKRQLSQKSEFGGAGRCIADHAETRALGRFLEMFDINPSNGQNGGRYVHGSQLQIYVTHTPCQECQGHLDYSGIEILPKFTAAK